MGDDLRISRASYNCDIEMFKECAKSAGGQSEQLMNMLEKTGRLSCEYFLPWQDEFHEGGTGYIDGVRSSSVEQSVQWGIDPWKRIFTTLHFTDIPGSEKENAVKENIEKQTAAVFQRYTVGGLLVSGGHYSNSLFFSAHALNDCDMNKLESLLKKGSVVYSDWKGDRTITLESPRKLT